MIMLLHGVNGKIEYRWYQTKNNYRLCTLCHHGDKPMPLMTGGKHLDDNLFSAGD